MSFPLQSTSLPLGAYVLSLSSLRDCIAAAASSPSDAIHLLDNSNLQHISTLSGHHGGITAIRAVSVLGSSTGTDILLSSGQDGRVNAWDLRSNKIAIQSKYFPNQIFSMRFSQLKLSVIDQ
jgi:WD40 repeat protein